MRRDFAALGLDEAYEAKADEFAKALLAYNRIHNISGARDVKSVWENIYDSVYALKFLPRPPKSAIDIGSGAGFPGILLALALPECHFELYEPIAKKSAFLHLIKAQLGLSNVSVKTERVESERGAPVDLIVSRAVTDTRALIALAKGFCDEKSVMILYKGSRAHDESAGVANARIHTRGTRQYIVIEGFGQC
jgi:16S rRNA (guanine527-N7)-methyltransferase